MAGSSVQLPQTPCEDGEDGEDGEMEKVVAGVLVLEEFDWKSVRSEMPLLRLVTSGVKGAIVKLNPRFRTFNSLSPFPPFLHAHCRAKLSCCIYIYIESHTHAASGCSGYM